MRRNRIDIIVEVLDVAKNGVNKTSIVYKTNLNFRIAERYLKLLEIQGFVENKFDKYITTNKGRVFFFLEKAREITLQLEAPLLIL
ncbi:MAG: hypothetical protein OIN88_11190 [Candidatus Methanoperedens sp.]|nr:hypothetical protein [Candidatus Methanoperedens sp.]